MAALHENMGKNWTNEWSELVHKCLVFPRLPLSMPNADQWQSKSIGIDWNWWELIGIDQHCYQCQIFGRHWSELDIIWGSPDSSISWLSLPDLILLCDSVLISQPIQLFCILFIFVTYSTFTRKLMYYPTQPGLISHLLITDY